jgi:hypothetical protein
VAVALWSAGVGCSGGGSDPDISRVEATGDVPRYGPIRPMDDRLVGLRTRRNDAPDQLVVSDDDGRTWRAAELPDRPPELELAYWSSLSLHVQRDLAVVVGRDPESASAVLPVAKPEFIVWTSPDGVAWDGQVLATAGGIVGAPTVTAAGPVLLASTSSIESFNLFTSIDHGSSWRRAEIVGLSHLGGEDLTLEAASVEGEELRMVVDARSGGPDRRQLLTSGDDGTTWSAQPCGHGCPRPVGPGDLLRRDGETSTDGGATWHRISVEPPPPGDGPPALSTVVEVPGGWLAAASTSEAGDISYGQLLRSDDGRSWRQMLPPDPCDSADIGRPNSDVGDPTRFDGRWYVTYDCSTLMTPVFGVIYTGGEGAREFTAIEATERDDVAFGHPVVDGDRLLVPEFDEEGLVGLTTIG